MRSKPLSFIFALLIAFNFTADQSAGVAQSTSFALAPRVKAGTPAPQVTFGDFSAPSMNQHGEVAFVAGSGSGVYLVSEDRITPVALAGQQAPGSDERFVSFSQPVLSNSGLVFQALQPEGLSFISEQPELSRREGLFLFSLADGRLQPIALQGQMIPEIQSRFEFFDRVGNSINNAGVVTFGAFVEPIKPTVMPGGGRQGLFHFADGVITPLLLAGQPVRMEGGGTVIFTFVGSPAINDSGAVAFLGTVAAAPGQPPQSGIYLYSEGTIKTVALEGEKASGTGGIFLFDRFSAPVINNSGSVAFQAALNSISFGSGIFIYERGTLRPLVISGQEAPGTNGSRFSLLISPPSMNDSGEVAFLAGLGNDPGRPMQQGVFLASRGNNQAVALHGEEAPGIDGGHFCFDLPDNIVVLPGGSFGVPQFPVSLNNPGDVAFRAGVATSSGSVSGLFVISGRRRRAVATTLTPLPPGASFSEFSDVSLSNIGLAFAAFVPGNGSGLYTASDEGFGIVALPSQPIPPDNAFAFVSAPAMNRRGSVTFFAQDSRQVEFFPSPPPPSGSGIYLFSDAGLRQLAARGQEAPGTHSQRLSLFGPPALNNQDEVAFYSVYNLRQTSSEPGFEFIAGIFQHSGENLGAVALDGQTAPETDGGIFSSFSIPVVFEIPGFPFFHEGDAVPGHVSINDSGAVAFHASVSGGRSSSGIFVSSEDVITPVVLSGQEAPGTGGGRFSDFGAPSINDHGSVVFQATIEGGTRNFGLFVARGGIISPVALAGDIAPGTEGKRFTGFFRPLINNNGAVAFQATLPSNGPNPFSFEEGLFLAAGESILPIALQGQDAPGTGGGVFSRFSPEVRVIVFPIFSPEFFTARFSLDDANKVAFIAEVTGGTVASAIFLATPPGLQFNQRLTIEVFFSAGAFPVPPPQGTVNLELRLSGGWVRLR